MAMIGDAGGDVGKITGRWESDFAIRRLPQFNLLECTPVVRHETRDRLRGPTYVTAEQRGQAGGPCVLSMSAKGHAEVASVRKPIGLTASCRAAADNLSFGERVRAAPGN